MDINPVIIGWIASTLTTVAFFPQAWKVMRTRDTRSISLGMYAIFTTGVSFWLVYGLMIESWPIIIGNIITTTLSAMILVLKLKYR